MNLSIRLCVSLVALAATVSAERIYVDAAARSSGDGKTWTTAFASLTVGLAKANKGDEIWVATGTYGGGFRVGDGVSIYGGFQTGDRRTTQRRGGSRSILDGGAKQRVLVLGQKSLVDGFVVQNGRGAPLRRRRRPPPAPFPPGVRVGAGC